MLSQTFSTIIIMLCCDGINGRCGRMLYLRPLNTLSSKNVKTDQRFETIMMPMAPVSEQCEITH